MTKTPPYPLHQPGSGPIISRFSHAFPFAFPVALPVALLLVAFLLSACAPTPPSPAEIAEDEQSARQLYNATRSLNLKPSPGDDFPVDDAKNLFSYGFDSIRERYIKDVHLEDLAIEGLKGLGTLDPALTVSLDKGEIHLNAPDGLLAVYPEPALEDVEGWARLTVAATLASRHASETLRQASAEKIYEAIFDAALAHLDNFSRYAGAEEARDHRASRNGFGGIGIRYQLEGGVIQVLDVIPHSPAEEAGLKPDDEIIAIDGESTQNMALRDVKTRLRGPMRTTCQLEVMRKQGTGGLKRKFEVEIVRGLVVPTTVTTERQGDAAIIRLSSFNQRTAQAMTEALQEIDTQIANGESINGIVLDMRGNPGGLLDQAVTVSDLFLQNGRIVFTRGRHPESRQSYDAGDDEDENESVRHKLPMVIVIDGRSASAAEIVAAALQDWGRGVVVGTTSYGKGTVQTVIRLPNEGEITLTWSRFHSPSGYALHGLGVLPTVCTSDITGDALNDETVVFAPIRRTSAIAHSPAANTLINTMAQWRASAPDDTDTRSSLRRFCPARSHMHNDDDITLAIQLLQNAALYEDALNLTHRGQSLSQKTPSH